MAFTTDPRLPRTRPRRPRRGFIILFGSRTILSNESGEPVRTVCPRCGQEADLLPRSYRNWFTLFFLPLFPISGKTRFTECGNCGGQFPVEANELRARLQVNDQEHSQQAIRLYNSLRASPANSVTLYELMQLYAAMKEFAQAESAARQFPDALNNSEQCMVMLGRIHLAQDRHADALRWFEAALARNDQLADGHYYKVVAHLTATPPNKEAAMIAARAALSAGHPNADELMREAT